MNHWPSRPGFLEGRWLVLAAVASTLSSCGRAVPTEAAARPIVYDTDDRRDYFDVPTPALRGRMAQSMVALVHRSALKQAADGLRVTAPSWGESAGLCAGEPFAEQPAAAFCSAVLVDWDLVLTSGHCVRAYQPEDMVALLGYYYDSPGQLAVGRADALPVAAIVAEALDPAGRRPRFDYAWLRLGNDVPSGRAPAPIRSRPEVKEASRVTAMGAVGGVPMKIDEGGAIFDRGAPWSDFFTASTDTAKGSSGGGAFDDGAALLGVLARGGDDFAPTEAGCRTTRREAATAPAQEEFTFAARALDALCAHDPTASSLCRPGCGDPCEALARPAEAGGCSVTGGPPGGGSLACAAGFLAAVFLRRRRPLFLRQAPSADSGERTRASGAPASGGGTWACQQRSLK